MYNPSIETLPTTQLQRLQTERLRHLVHYVYDRVPFYRDAFDQRGLKPHQIQTLQDLALVPFTKKQDLRDHYPFGLFAVPQNQMARIHASSGTTGKPTVVGYTRRDVEIFAEVNARSLAAAGARPGMMLHNAYGYGLFTGGLGLHYGAEKLGMQVVPVSGGMTERQMMLIQDFKPDVICCTPSYGQTLSENFRKRGIDPANLSLSFALLGAEPWTETIRADVDRGLGVRATNIYGLSEIIGPGVSQECVEARDGSHVFEDHFYPEIIDRDTGEPVPEGQDGVLVFTTLTKEAMPLLRYWTGDITYLNREPCICGRTHARMGPIKGRADDMLIIRGVNLYPTQIEAVLDHVDDVVPHYQLVVRRQGTMDEAELKLEVTENIAHIAHQDIAKGVDFADHPQVQHIQRQIQHKIKDTIGLTLKVTLWPPGEVPRSAGGKLRRVLDERKL